MNRQQYLDYCYNEFGTSPDYPFDDIGKTAVLRHSYNRKWYALIMRLPKSKLGIKSEEYADVVNLKLPTQMIDSFGAEDGVYPAYHMNKMHWVSVLLNSADESTVKFLTNASFSVTKPKIIKKK